MFFGQGFLRQLFTVGGSAAVLCKDIHTRNP